MVNEDRESSKLSRRDFARRAAIVTATAAALPGEVLAAARPRAVTDKEAQAEIATAEDQAEIASKIQTIFRQYGDRLSDAQKAEIRRLVQDGQKPLEAMRAFPLDNADQPGNVLKLYPDPPGEDDAAAGPRR